MRFTSFVSPMKKRKRTMTMPIAEARSYAARGIARPRTPSASEKAM